jgi:sec-independent protein translocase protein TatA
MPFGIGVWEILILLLVALLVFGPKKLPEMGKQLGRGMREFKDSIGGKHDDDDDDEDVKDLKKDEKALPPRQPEAEVEQVEPPRAPEDEAEVASVGEAQTKA